MDQELIAVFQKLARFSHLILYLALIAWIIFFRKLSILHKTLIGYVIVLLGSDYLMKIFSHLYGNTMIVLYIYSFFELAFMVYFYKKCMYRGKQRLLTYLSFAGLLYIVVEMFMIFVFKGLVIKDFQPYAKVADNFVIILMALAYLYERMSQFREQEWGSFRLNMVFLVFFTLNTLMFLPFNFMVNASNIKFYFWAGHTILLILFYLYLTFEIMRDGLKSTSSAGLKR